MQGCRCVVPIVGCGGGAAVGVNVAWCSQRRITWPIACVVRARHHLTLVTEQGRNRAEPPRAYWSHYLQSTSTFWIASHASSNEVYGVSYLGSKVVAKSKVCGGASHTRVRQHQDVQCSEGRGAHCTGHKINNTLRHVRHAHGTRQNRAHPIVALCHSLGDYSW